MHTSRLSSTPDAARLAGQAHKVDQHEVGGSEHLPHLGNNLFEPIRLHLRHGYRAALTGSPSGHRAAGTGPPWADDVVPHVQQGLPVHDALSHGLHQPVSRDVGIAWKTHSVLRPIEPIILHGIQPVEVACQRYATEPHLGCIDASLL